MIGSLLITLREGLEAALIIGIILAYLARSGNRRAFGQVWVGAGLAVLVSLGAGALIYILAGDLSGRAEQVFEGIAMFVAVAVLTWMVFWMKARGRGIKAHLQSQVQSALSAGSSFALAGLAFIVVVREGIETALFLFAATRVAESGLAVFAGGIIGLAAAVLIGYVVYRGSGRLNLKTFFSLTGLVLIVFASGLLAHGIHEFHEAGLIPPVIEHVWDLNGVLPERSTFGRFLTALTGYNANPSLVEVVAYALFLGATLAVYLRPAGQGPAAARLKVEGGETAG